MKRLLTIFACLLAPVAGCMALVDSPTLEPEPDPSGTGGISGTGGFSVVITSGGAPGSGGSFVSSSGGMGSGGAATGGTGTGGQGGSRMATGGAASGGRAATGGAASGGRPATGGAGTGGASTAVVCSSNVQWNGSTGPNMRPGVSCRGCHSYVIAGTVYPTLHEPTNCNGTNASSLRVIITGANGATLTLTPNSAGNFFSNTSVATPFTARVMSSAGTRMMGPSQTSGDCNSCHTQNGANGAPGRIMAP